jgi:hypothetical protein
VCQSHTGRLTGLWFLPKPAFGLNTNDDDDDDDGVSRRDVGYSVSDFLNECSPFIFKDQDIPDDDSATCYRNAGKQIDGVSHPRIP